MQASRRSRTGESLPSNRTQVPKLLMSVSTKPLLRQSMRACRRDTRGSLMHSCAWLARPTCTGASDEVNDMFTPCHENWICPRIESTGAKLLTSAACMVRESGASFSRHST